MYQPVHEQLARVRHAEREARTGQVGIRRSARLISIQFRRQRRTPHA